ncbi:YibE/F family protein [Candidatus Kaiserbacteria bacterium]|nr:YibE/F family protein [Candidatus Kaiserbacteria bacterium]
MMRIAAILLLCAGMCGVVVPRHAAAQELTPDTVTTMKARVVKVLAQERYTVPGVGIDSTYQTLQVEVLDGPEKGAYVTVEYDMLQLEEGDVFFLRHTVNHLDATDYYAVMEPYRLPALGILSLLFVIVVVAFGGWQGARGLLSLVASIGFIVFLLLPGILKGYPPIALSAGVASLMVVIGSYITHGFNRTTHVAVAGMMITVIATAVLAYVAIPFAQLTGFHTEEATYLNIDTRGAIDLAGLLIGAIIIGALGVLYDAAIAQAVAVEEISAAGPDLSKRHVYRRALRVGRTHIGALVDTLAIAYVGASLPLLLLFTGFGGDSLLMSLNRELFATELVRTIIGSIGIILAVPVTTAIAAYFLVDHARRHGVESSHGHRH